MIPAVVRYSGLEVAPLDVIDRRRFGPIPLDWTRHQFALDGYQDPSYGLSNFVSQNLSGRWSLNVTSTNEGTIVVIGFENDMDAVMFKMLDGETEWKNFESTRIF